MKYYKQVVWLWKKQLVTEIFKIADQLTGFLVSQFYRVYCLHMLQYCITNARTYTHMHAHTHAYTHTCTYIHIPGVGIFQSLVLPLI